MVLSQRSFEGGGQDMIPKKIYLNYVNEKDEDKTWSEAPVNVSDCKMQNREYTDLSQVWHDASKLPMSGKRILVLHDDGTLETWIIPRTFETALMFSTFGVDKWAYIEDLLPQKIEEL